MVSDDGSFITVVFTGKLQFMIHKLFINVIKGKGSWLCTKYSGYVLKIRTKTRKAVKNKVNISSG